MFGHFNVSNLTNILYISIPCFDRRIHTIVWEKASNQEEILVVVSKFLLWNLGTAQRFWEEFAFLQIARLEEHFLYNTWCPGISQVKNYMFKCCRDIISCSIKLVMTTAIKLHIASWIQKKKKKKKLGTRLERARRQIGDGKEDRIIQM